MEGGGFVFPDKFRSIEFLMVYSRSIFTDLKSQRAVLPDSSLVDLDLD
jgi:hypothetical protein